MKRCLSNAMVVGVLVAALSSPGVILARQGGTGPAIFNARSSARACRPVAIRPAPVAKAIRRERPVLEPALQWFGGAIATARSSQGGARAVAAELERMAQAGAFVQLDWSGSGSAPAHWQTNLLKNVAFAVNIIDHRSGWASPAQRQAVVGWGDALYQNSHFTGWGGRKQSDRWPDTVAAAAAAYVSWGVVTSNRKALNEGLRDFKKVAQTLKPSGGTQTFFIGGLHEKSLPKSWGARLEDKMLGDLVLAAHAARRAGKDLFNQKSGKVSLHDAVVGWQDTLFGNGGAAVRGQDMSFLARSGGERSWAWTEFFTANFPNDPATATLRAKSAQIRGGGYSALSMGPTTCLIR